MEAKKNDLTNGAVVPVLLKFMVPILLAFVLQATYGFVDLWVVTKFSTVGEVAGVTIGSQINNVLLQACAGLAMGTTILLGLHIGSKEEHKASRTIGTSIILFAIISVIITFGLFFGADALVAITQTPVEAISATKDYIIISAYGATFLVFYNLLGSIFRGIGDSKTPLISVAIACVFNTVLDLILVAVYDMGAAGAAYATTIAQGLSVVICLLVIRKKELPFTFHKKDITWNGYFMKETFRLGFPMALQSVLSTASFLAITAIINTFGVYASSAVGIVQKITMYTMMISVAFMQALSAFVAQNRGAGLMDRSKRGLYIGLILSFVFSLFIAYIVWFHGTIFINIFTTEAQLVSASLEFLRAYALEGIAVSIYFCMIGYFNGCGRTTFVSVQGTLMSIVVRLPLTYLFAQYSSNLTIVGLSIPISTVLQIIICIVFYRWVEKQNTTNTLNNTQVSA